MRRFGKCYADRGEALAWCCVLLLRRSAVRWDAGLGGASLNGRRLNRVAASRARSPLDARARRSTENTTVQQMQLWIFWAIVAAFLVCGCILTWKPKESPPSKAQQESKPAEPPPSG